MHITEYVSLWTMFTDSGLPELLPFQCHERLNVTRQTEIPYMTTCICVSYKLLPKDNHLYRQNLLMICDLDLIFKCHARSNILEQIIIHTSAHIL